MSVESGEFRHISKCREESYYEVVTYNDQREASCCFRVTRGRAGCGRSKGFVDRHYLFLLKKSARLHVPVKAIAASACFGVDFSWPLYMPEAPKEQ